MREEADTDEMEHHSRLPRAVNFTRISLSSEKLSLRRKNKKEKERIFCVEVVLVYNVGVDHQKREQYDDDGSGVLVSSQNILYNNYHKRIFLRTTDCAHTRQDDTRSS